MIGMIILSVLVVFAAGLIVDLFKVQVNKTLKLLVSFSGSLLLGIAIFHLFPGVFDFEYGPHAIIAGFIIQLLLEMTTAGMEHGHVHTTELKRFPIGLFAGLCLHALFEATPVMEHHHHDHHHGNSLFMAILIHKLPVSAVLMMFLVAGGIGRLKSYLALLVFAAMVPLNYFLVESVHHIEGFDFERLFSFVSGISAGMILHVSTTILLETSNNHKFNLLKFSTVVLGFVSALIMA